MSAAVVRSSQHGKGGTWQQPARTRRHSAGEARYRTGEVHNLCYFYLTLAYTLLAYTGMLQHHGGDLQPPRINHTAGNALKLFPKNDKNRQYKHM